MRVWIDQDLCTGDGLCVDHCPEVFVQLETGKPPEHAGSLRAPDPELALLNARDVYARRVDAT